MTFLKKKKTCTLF